MSEKQASGNLNWPDVGRLGAVFVVLYFVVNITIALTPLRELLNKDKPAYSSPSSTVIDPRMVDISVKQAELLGAVATSLTTSQDNMTRVSQGIIANQERIIAHLQKLEKEIEQLDDWQRAHPRTNAKRE